MKTWQVLFIFISLSLILGCKEQDPYPTDGELVIVKRDEQQAVKPALSIVVNDILKFREGRLTTYKIRFAVRDGGAVLAQVKNLPAGATFDEEAHTIIWKPNYFDGNDPKDPSVSSKLFPITIMLRNADDPKSAKRRNINLQVVDIPRKITINRNRSNFVNEGATLRKEFTIENKDFPRGPFKVLLDGMPANTKLEKVTENRYAIIFKPSFYHVNRLRDGRSKTHKGRIIISNPSNVIEEGDFEITVKDVRLNTKIVAAAQITQGLDVSFQVIGYDLNREQSPKMELLSDKPNFGKFRVEEVKNADSFSTVMNVHWTDIPPTYNGQSLKLGFKACVRGICSEGETNILIQVKPRKEPVINRDSWKVGELVYLDNGKEYTRDLKITDGENPNLAPKVEIFPEEMRKYVKWGEDKSNKNKLRMMFDKAGVFQFNIVATSEYNVSRSESFIVDVFKKNRKKVLFFADSTRDPEVLFYKDRFKGTMDIMNPAIQKISKRNMSGRETLVIGTSTLIDKAVAPQTMEAIDLVNNIVVASPLLENLPERFLKKLRKKYDLDFIGRYSMIPNLPPLASMKLAATSQFEKPKKDIFLKLTTSDASKDPLLFNGGLHDTQKICKGVVGITPNGLNPFVVGAVCDRDNGGRISILGIEWADFKTEKEDKLIPVKWFEKMVNGQF